MLPEALLSRTCSHGQGGRGPGSRSGVSGIRPSLAPGTQEGDQRTESQRDGDAEAQRDHAPASVGTGARLHPVKVCLGLERKRLERSGRHLSPQSVP